ncbi:acyl carrier protein phosphodiesterase [Chitinolyticbacter albus]|uniref:acyl carrier protein phosphodiesterase n=1 Tax=Chitinolyticbacter albus TaxID=2961951 RepID=UPI00210D9591|nr:ACP phosphodiesterase [Chitinolyticbacter albus]
MNYLAHLYLAGDEAADRVGGLMGDFVRGPLPGALPPDLAAGVALHRAIDAWADTHPAFQASRARVSPVRRRVAGIMVDLYYDHFLARDWSRYHHLPLTDFAAMAYAETAARSDALPERLAQQLPNMRQYDWLASYADPANVGYALDRMAQRLRQPNSLAGAGEELLRDYAGFAADFALFLPDARAFAEAWRRRNTAGSEAP